MDKMNQNQIRPTGITELDFVLNGGLPWNAAVLLAGPPGAGKTILALQWLFAGYRDFQESGIYFTMTETTTKLLRDLHKMKYYDKEFVSSVDARGGSFDKEIFQRPGIHLIDLRTVLKDFGLGTKEYNHADIKKICDILVEVADKTGAKRIVIDSVTALTYRLKTEDLVRTMIFELGAYLGAMEANIILIGEGDPLNTTSFGVEGFISDGIIRMTYTRVGRELLRTIEIVKMRGIDFDEHLTSFRISSEGLLLYPRRPRPFDYPVSNERMATGVAGMDELMSGGYLLGTTVCVMGPSGVGKSVMGMHFLHDGLKKGEHCIHVSFEESHDQIIQNAATFGFEFEKFEKNGLLQIIAVAPEQRYIEEHVNFIAEAFKANGAKRLVIDSLSSLDNDFGEEGVRDFTARMSLYSKNQGTTVMFTLATEGLIGSSVLSESHISSSIDSIILIRYVEISAELRRAVLVLKMRGTEHDRKLRELVIDSAGMRISTGLSGYESIMSGTSRKVSVSIEDQVRTLFMEVLGPMGEKIFQEESRIGLDQDRLDKLIEKLGSQGILSLERKKKFLEKTSAIFATDSVKI